MMNWLLGILGVFLLLGGIANDGEIPVDHNMRIAAVVIGAIFVITAVLIDYATRNEE